MSAPGCPWPVQFVGGLHATGIFAFCVIVSTIINKEEAETTQEFHSSFLLVAPAYKRAISGQRCRLLTTTFRSLPSLSQPSQLVCQECLSPLSWQSTPVGVSSWLCPSPNRSRVLNVTKRGWPFSVIDKKIIKGKFGQGGGAIRKLWRADAVLWWGRN